jgi:predicted transcriptional regulator
VNKNELQKLTKRGLSTYKIAEAMGCSQTNVRYWLKKFKLKTESDKPLDFCLACSKKLTGKSTKYCGENCKASYRYSSQPNTNEYQKRRSKERKLFFIEQKGGCCQKCGYKKNLSALSFHHRSPAEKHFGLEGRKLSNTSIKKLQIEADKCDLLCLNCHAETHNPDLSI